MRSALRTMIGEHLVSGDDAGPRIDQEQHEVGLRDCSLRLAAHAWRESFVAALETCRVDQPHRAGPKLGVGLAPVAR